MRWNRSAAMKTNLPPEHILGQAVFARVLDDPARRHQESLQVISSGVPLLASIEYVQQGGEVSWFTVDKLPLRDKKGDVTGLLVFIYDVSEWKRLNQQLEQAKERLEQLVAERTAELAEAAESLRATETRGKALLSATPDMMFRLKADGTFLDYVSPLMETFIPPDSIIGTNLSHDAFPGHFADSARAAIQQALHSERVINIHYRLTLPDGSHDYEARLAKCGLDEVVATVRDVSENRKLQAALEASEERFRLVVEGSMEGVWDWNDTQPGLLYLSPRVEELLGYETGEIPRTTTFFTSHVIHPEDLDRARETCGRPRPGTEFLDLEIRLHIKDGSCRWFRVRGIALQDGKKLTRVVGSLQDIHDRKRAEEQIRELNHQLDERVRRRTKELEQANRELESFSYSVSHDLRAPLRAIDGYSEALLDVCGEVLTGQGREYLERICSAAGRMGRQIDDLMILSRVSLRPVHFQILDLSSMAASVAEELQRATPERNVTVRITPGLCVPGDPDLVRIAIENLFSNAWKFTARRQDAIIDLGILPEKSPPVYFVRDNGAGFNMAFAGKMFGPFQRLHHLSEFPGSGIGLATVQRIVHKHGGIIWARGVVDKGATFYFTLPADGRSGGE